MISDPLERILALENKFEQLRAEMNNKVNVQELYNELIKKADINDLKALEASLIRLNELINDLTNQFADRVENEKAHKLLQKNLKNLYELFMSLKGDGNEDDPMFTTKGLNCASCAKGVTNMLGFRADHFSWNNFPFKEPSQRMAKMGQGFSKIYNQSQYDHSYYNHRTSANDLNEAALSDHQMFKGAKTTPGNKKSRPMTAKVNKKGLY